MPGDLPGAHAACVHRHDLVVETRKTALVLGDQLRIKAARTIAGHLDLDLASVGNDGLAAIAIAAVADLVLMSKMMVHLGIERAFGQCLLQRIQQTAVLKSRSGVATGQKLIE